MRSQSINGKLQHLLRSIKLNLDEVNFYAPLRADVRLVFKINWFFEIEEKDRVVAATTSKETVENEETLRNFVQEQRKDLEKSRELRRPFLDGLEKRSARELFLLANRVNRISPRHMKAECLCPDCKGRKKIQCPNCSGYGVILCPSCQGQEGGCSFCQRNGYVECPTCRQSKLVPCTTCNAQGRAIINKRICLLAKSTSLLEVEISNSDALASFPVPVVDYACYEELLSSLFFGLKSSEYGENDVYKLTYAVKTSCSALRFDVRSIPQTLCFFAVDSKFIPLCYPHVLDYTYELLKIRLQECGVGSLSSDVKAKIELFSEIVNKPFLCSLLKGYESDYDRVYRHQKSEKGNSDNFIPKAYSLKDRLANIVASRKDSLARLLSRKLLSHTNNMMTEEFGQELCYNLVNFISNLKYRGVATRRIWDYLTLFIWGMSFFLNFFSHNLLMLFLPPLISIMLSIFTSYYITRNLKLYEVVMFSRTFTKISKFLDTKYDMLRSSVMFFGVLFIETLVYVLTQKYN